MKAVGRLKKPRSWSGGGICGAGPGGRVTRAMLVRLALPLMGRFDISQETADEYRAKFRDVVQPLVGEQVLAVGTFRTTGAGTRYGVSKMQLGALAYAASSLRGKKQAGGLPSSFLLAVTPSKMHAFAYKM